MMNPKFYFEEIPDGGSGGPGFMWKKEEFTILCDCSEADSIHISVPSSWVIGNNYRYNFIYKIKGADGDFHNTSTWSAEGDEITGSYDGGTFVHHGTSFDNESGSSGGPQNVVFIDYAGGEYTCSKSHLDLLGLGDTFETVLFVTPSGVTKEWFVNQAQNFRIEISVMAMDTVAGDTLTFRKDIYYISSTNDITVSTGDTFNIRGT